MKSPDQEARQCARCLIAAAQLEADEGHGFVVPASVVRSLRVIPQHACKIPTFSLHEAARLLGVPLAVLDREVGRHLVVHDIVAGAGRSGTGRLGASGRR